MLIEAIVLLIESIVPHVKISTSSHHVRWRSKLVGWLIEIPLVAKHLIIVVIQIILLLIKASFFIVIDPYHQVLLSTRVTIWFVLLLIGTLSLFIYLSSHYILLACRTHCRGILNLHHWLVKLLEFLLLLNLELKIQIVLVLLLVLLLLELGHIIHGGCIMMMVVLVSIVSNWSVESLRDKIIGLCFLKWCYWDITLWWTLTSIVRSQLLMVYLLLLLCHVCTLLML